MQWEGLWWGRGTVSEHRESSLQQVIDSLSLKKVIPSKPLSQCLALTVCDELGLSLAAASTQVSQKKTGFLDKTGPVYPLGPTKWSSEGWFPQLFQGQCYIASPSLRCELKSRFIINSSCLKFLCLNSPWKTRQKRPDCLACTGFNSQAPCTTYRRLGDTCP